MTHLQREEMNNMFVQCFLKYMSEMLFVQYKIRNNAYIKLVVHLLALNLDLDKITFQ